MLRMHGDRFKIRESKIETQLESKRKVGKVGKMALIKSSEAQINRCRSIQVSYS